MKSISTRYLAFIVIVASFTCAFSKIASADDYFVFFPYSGTINSNAAVAIQYDYDGPSPVHEALTKFFDGPSEGEAVDAEIFKPFQCAHDDFIFFDCGAADIFKSVRIENGIAYIELLGVPMAATSAQTTSFIRPLRFTVTQFPNVTDFKFVLRGIEFDIIREGCPVMCFLFGLSEDQVNDWLEHN